MASGLMRSISVLGLEAERDARRQRALAAATALSIGVEDETFRAVSDNAAPGRSFAEVEADIIRTVRHATVGGTALEVTGRRLDGTEDRLSSYRAG